MEAFLRNQILNVCRIRNPRIQRARMEKHEILPYRVERICVDGEMLAYNPDGPHRVGVYIASEPLSPEDNYFELEIIDAGVNSCIAIGLVPYQYPLNAQPGWKAFGVGYHADDGRLYKGSGLGQAFGPRCRTGDKMGCGIKFQMGGNPPHAGLATVFFTRNGKELGIVKVPMPPGGLHPAVGLHSDGEEVRLNLEAEWMHDDLTMMAVDHCEEEWKRLHDISVSGTVLEYTGRGKTIHDVGLAQAGYPLSTTNHYFELEIVDPGESCYIAIGIARKNYPKHRHPGWNRESVAYHADDGKIFVGSGIGDPFGPRCHKDYEPDLEPELSDEEDYDDPIDLIAQDDSAGSEEEDDSYANPPLPRGEEKGGLVEVFFTRNGKMIGKRQMPIPKGGFYPTIGMLSSCEKVRVDLRPLTG